MKKIFLLGSLFVLLMSFTLTAYQPAADAPVKAKPIDVTLTSQEGCIIHIVGDLNYSIIPPKVKGFHGTITISGPKGCPNVTLTVNYGNRQAEPGYASIDFDTDDICAISTVKWYGADPVINDLQANTQLNETLIAALKEGICDPGK